MVPEKVSDWGVLFLPIIKAFELIATSPLHCVCVQVEPSWPVKVPSTYDEVAETKPSKFSLPWEKVLKLKSVNKVNKK